MERSGGKKWSREERIGIEWREMKRNGVMSNEMEWRSRT